MIEASQFKRGECISFQDQPFLIVDVQFTTPTARGASPIAKTRLRNLITGKLLTESIRTSEKFDEVLLEKRPCSYLYKDTDHWHFMDAENYEQFQLDAEEIGDAAGFLKDGLEDIQSMVIDGKIVGIVLPQIVTLQVVETDPAIKGATAKAQMKAAVLETGITVQVPPYLNVDEWIRVDTRDGHFVERAKGD
jgi:elongation factor P